MYSICIADDEKYVLKSIAQRISSSGMELEVVGMAGNGLEALELYDREQPDIFFVDINMPVVNGLDFIERIRKKDPDVRTRFIIISGYDDFAYMKKAIQLGVINYIKNLFCSRNLRICSGMSAGSWMRKGKRRRKKKRISIPGQISFS